MGKRSSFVRKDRDFYPTPLPAVYPLLPHLDSETAFVEPCAGDGALVEHLEAAGHQCLGSSDIEPQVEWIDRLDVFDLEKCGGDVFITNPPWDRMILHPLITHLSDMAPTWLLFDGDWAHTKQAVQFLPRLKKVVSVGRVKWIADSSSTGKDNCAWYLFSSQESDQILFFGRGHKNPLHDFGE